MFRCTGPGRQCRPSSQRSSLIRNYIVYHSVYIHWTHYSAVRQPCSNFRVITELFLVTRVFFSCRKARGVGGGGEGASEQHNNTICIHSYDMRPNSPMSILSCCHRRFIRLCCFILSTVRNKTHKIIQYHLLLFSYFQNKHILSCS